MKPKHVGALLRVINIAKERRNELQQILTPAALAEFDRMLQDAADGLDEARRLVSKVE